MCSTFRRVGARIASCNNGGSDSKGIQPIKFSSKSYSYLHSLQINNDCRGPVSRLPSLFCIPRLAFTTMNISLNIIMNLSLGMLTPASETLSMSTRLIRSMNFTLHSPVGCRRIRFPSWRGLLLVVSSRLK